jgi:CBS domain-containing protein
MVAPPDVAEFLRAHPPFSDLSPGEVDALAAVVEVEFIAAGTVIFAEGDAAPDRWRVVRSGVVEVVHEGRVLDALGPGEVFGHAALLAGLPSGFTARAGEDVLCYAIPAAAATAFLAAPTGLRFVARHLLEDPHHLRGGPRGGPPRDRLRQPVRSALRRPAVVVAPTTTVGEAARQMTEARSTALVVALPDSLGILTDADLRERVVAAGRDPATTVAEVMSTPALTVEADLSGSEALLEMLEHGVRHLPVLSGGRVVGVLEDHDLLSVEARASVVLRRAIARAATLSELAEVSGDLRGALLAAHHSGVGALEAMSAHAALVEAVVRRALDLTLASRPVEVPFAWVVLGSVARREALFSSDLDSAVAYEGPESSATTGSLVALAQRVTAAVEAAGAAPDENRVSATDPLFVRPLDSWRAEALSVLADPTQEKGLVVASVLLDGRNLGPAARTGLDELVRLARAAPSFVRLLGRWAVAETPPSGFARGRALGRGAREDGRLDLKVAGARPLVALARWAAVAAGSREVATTARLAAARAAGTLSEDDADVLRDAYALVSELRLDHQAAQVDAGREPDDLVETGELSPLERAYLKEAFRAVAAVQRRVANETALGA